MPHYGLIAVHSPARTSEGDPKEPRLRGGGARERSDPDAGRAPPGLDGFVASLPRHDGNAWRGLRHHRHARRHMWWQPAPCLASGARWSDGYTFAIPGTRRNASKSALFDRLYAFFSARRPVAAAFSDQFRSAPPRWARPDRPALQYAQASARRRRCGPQRGCLISAKGLGHNAHIPASGVAFFTNKP
jgi:hypothetical protein